MAHGLHVAFATLSKSRSGVASCRTRVMRHNVKIGELIVTHYSLVPRSGNGADPSFPAQEAGQMVSTVPSWEERSSDLARRHGVDSPLEVPCPAQEHASPICEAPKPLRQTGPAMVPRRLSTSGGTGSLRGIRGLQV